MNKKLLGIAAVALLRVSATFAATTSTIYFTASGTLTKFISSLSGVKETTDDPCGCIRSHTGEKDVGVLLLKLLRTNQVIDILVKENITENLLQKMRLQIL